MGWGEKVGTNVEVADTCVDGGSVLAGVHPKVVDINVQKERKSNNALLAFAMFLPFCM